MFKVGPAAKASGSVWDEKGKSEIAQIYIGVYENRFKFIQFLNVENGTTLATSKILGLPCEGGCTFFNTVSKHLILCFNLSWEICVRLGTYILFEILDLIK